MAARELSDADVFGAELSDAEVFGAGPAGRPGPRQPSGRGFAFRPARQPESVLDRVPVDPASVAAGVSVLFDGAVTPRTGNTQLDAAQQVLDARTPIQSALDKNRSRNAQRRQEGRRVVEAREQTDAAFGSSPVGQAIAAPGRRLAAGVAQAIGGVAGIPQLFGSDLGAETAAAMDLMAKANMPEDPGIADEILAGVGQVAPMIGGAAAARGALVPLLGDAGATGVATGMTGAAGGAMSGGEVLRDLQDRSDLTDSEKRGRALFTAIMSGVTGAKADRLLIPGADRAVAGPLQAGGRAFIGEGAQEGFDQLTQNFATDRALGEGVGRAALVGGAVGGGVRSVGELGSAGYQLASALDAEARAFADAPAPQVVQQPVARAVAAPMVQPTPPVAEAAPAVPALSYDPSVRPSSDVMVASPDGTVRPMTDEEVWGINKSKEEAQDSGLTPDVRRAQDARSRSESAAPEQVETPDLVRRLMDAGWKPPENANAPTVDSSPDATDTTPAADAPAAPDRPVVASAARDGGNARTDSPAPGGPDAALTDAIGQDLEQLYQQEVKESIRERLGLAKPEKEVEQPRNTGFLRFLRRNGVAADLAQDIYGDNAGKANRALPGVFKKAGLQLDELVVRAVEEGFLTPGDVESALDNGGTRRLTELIQDQIRGKAPISTEMAQDIAGQEAGRRLATELDQQARAIGFDTRGMTDDQVAGALRRIERRRAAAGQRQQELDAREEARLERLAIDNEPSLTDEQLDALDADWLAGDNVTLADAMMALGFDPQEIADATKREDDRRGAAASAEPAAGAAPRPGAADEGSPGRQDEPGEALSRYTPDEVEARERQAREAGREEERQRQEREQRAQADAQRGDFKLTGSDRPADKAAAEGQEDLFSKPAPTSSEGFKRWFTGSKVVDADGQPLVVFHGSPDARFVDEDGVFATMKDRMLRFGNTPESRRAAEMERGFFFTTSRGVAQTYADPKRAFDYQAAEPAVIPAYLAVRNPLEFDAAGKHWREAQRQVSKGDFIATAKKAGHDGVVIRNVRDSYDSMQTGRDPTSDVWVAFDSRQIKSADRNDGNFDPANPDIRRSVGEGGSSTATSMREELGQRFGDLIPRLETRGFLKLWDSVDDYNQQAGQASRIDGAAAGYYIRNTNTAHLFGDGIERGNALGVFLHEVGEHASMKAMLGDRYQDLVQRAYDLVEQGDDIANTAMMRIPEDTPDKFMDSELVAYMIEEAAGQQKPTAGMRKWLADTLSALRAWFFQTGFAKKLEGYGVRMDLTPADFAALAVRAVQWQAQQGQEAEQEGAEPVPAYSRPRTAAQAAAATFGNRPPGNPNTLASAAQPWTVAEPGTWDNVVRQVQNNKIDLKRVRDAIEQRFGRVPEQADAYLQEELYHGRVAARIERLHKDSIEPILRKIAVAEKDHGVTVDDVNRYLHARHAPERNAAMAAINPAMQNNQALSGMSDADAAQALADFRTAGKDAPLAAIVKDIDQLLGDTRTALVADGLEDAGVIQAWEQAYQHYVPLMRDIEDRPAKGSGFSVRGPEAKRAVGSNRQVVNILANVVTQAETAAIRAEKAEVGRALLEMAQQYPNPDFWKVDTPPTKPRVNSNTGLVERAAVDPLFQTADNVLMVKDYGATRFLVFNRDNARAMEVARAMKNLDVAAGNKILEIAGKGTRFMASLLTQRNPEFWLTNFARDLQGSMIQMGGTDAEGLQAKVLANLPKALGGVRDLVRGTGSGQWARYAGELKDAGGTTGYMQMFENSDARMKDLQGHVDRMNQGAADPRRVARAVLDFIDDYNDVIENGMRLAVFQAAREAGVSTQRAASIAKNVTVNFNRKGNLTPTVNSLYMFFNAGVQGTARLAQALTTSRTAQVAVGGMAAAAFIMDIVNRAMAGEDDETKRNRYDLIPEFEKSRNWIVMNPAKPGTYIKVPLPLGFHVFHNAGRLAADAAFRKDPRNASEYGWSFASTVFDAFSPLGGFASVGQLIAPSLADPVVQLAENKTFTGGPVYRSREQGFGKVDPKPAYTRFFENTPDVWKAASRALNDATGGDKDKPGMVNVEPDVLRHIYTAMTGGPGRALDRTVDAAQGKAMGQDVTASRLPLTSRFYGENDDRQKKRAFFEDQKRAAVAKAQYDNYMKAGRRELALEVVTELGQGDAARGRRMLAEFGQGQKDIRTVNRRLRDLQQDNIDDSAQKEQLAALRKRRTQLRKRTLLRTADDDSE